VTPMVKPSRGSRPTLQHETPHVSERFLAHDERATERAQCSAPSRRRTSPARDPDETAEAADARTVGAMDRRKFLELAVGAALTPAVAHLASTLTSTRAFAAPARAKRRAARPVTLGFIALTDCASLVMAKELGYFEDHGLDVTLQKQASWPATR